MPGSSWLSGLRPDLKAGLDGSVRVQFEDYDALVMGYVTGRGYADQVPPAFWPAPLDEQFPDAAGLGGPRGQDYGKILRSYTRAIRTHFQERNWTARGVLILPTADGGLGLNTQRHAST